MFFRNAINNGVLVIDCEALVHAGLAQGDTIEIDIERGEVRAKGQAFPIAPIPDVVKRIVQAGSLIEYGRTLMQESSRGGGHATTHAR